MVVEVEVEVEEEVDKEVDDRPIVKINDCEGLETCCQFRFHI